MKVLASVTLLACLSTAAFAGEEFGGINFDSSVPGDQVSIMKKDLKYLYETPITDSDNEFLATTGLQGGSGDHLHNWVVNRVRYIVGEFFDIDNRIKMQPKLFFKFPQTPIPDGLGNTQEIEQVRRVMTNLGGALYLGGKMQDILVGLKLDNETVSIKSPRVGVLQVGEGLFYDGFLINQQDKYAAANSISRLGTFFHEARHSDGNGKSTGFVHTKCPTGHDYEGHPACEISGNGSYSVGALAERHLLKNCTECSTEDKTILSAAIADAFDRIFDTDKVRQKAAHEADLRGIRRILEIYTTNPWPDSMRDKVNAEIESLKQRISELEAKLASMSIKPDVKPASLDAAPEGSFKEINVSKSSQLMKSSLRK